MFAEQERPDDGTQIDPSPPTITIERTKIEKPNWNSEALITVL